LEDEPGLGGAGGGGGATGAHLDCPEEEVTGGDPCDLSQDVWCDYETYVCDEPDGSPGYSVNSYRCVAGEWALALSGDPSC
jgi:hypothetical protein